MADADANEANIINQWSKQKPRHNVVCLASKPEK